jgi:hypothetical protein
MAMSVLSVALLGLVLMTQSGCLVAAAAAGTGAAVVYSKGDKDFTADATVAQCMSAAASTMQDLKYNIEKNESSASDGEIFARSATDRSVKIHVTYLADKSTRVNIKVGTWGDETITQQIWDTMRTYLPQPPQTQPAQK